MVSKLIALREMASFHLSLSPHAWGVGYENGFNVYVESIWAHRPTDIRVSDHAVFKDLGLHGSRGLVVFRVSRHRDIILLYAVSITLP